MSTVEKFWFQFFSLIILQLTMEHSVQPLRGGEHNTCLSTYLQAFVGYSQLDAIQLCSFSKEYIENYHFLTILDHFPFTKHIAYTLDPFCCMVIWWFSYDDDDPFCNKDLKKGGCERFVKVLCAQTIKFRIRFPCTARLGTSKSPACV